MANLFMHESGCTSEQMASVVTALRSWATKDPNSFFYGKDVPSVEKVLARTCLIRPCTRERAMCWVTAGVHGHCLGQGCKKMKRPAAYKLGDSVRYFSGTCVMRDFNKVNEGFRGNRQRGPGPGRNYQRRCQSLEFISGLSLSPSPYSRNARSGTSGPGRQVFP